MNALVALAALAATPFQAPPQGAQLPVLVWSDFERDGFEDARALHAGALSLFRNAAAGHVDECSGQVGLAALPPLSAAGWVDFDRDGSPDLFALTADGAPLLLRNESGAAFHDLTQAAGLALDEPVLQAEWLDADDDGEPDLLVWTRGAVRLFRNVGGTFEGSELTLAPASSASVPTSAGFGAVPPAEPGGAAGAPPERTPRVGAVPNGRSAVPPPRWAAAPPQRRLSRAV